MGIRTHGKQAVGVDIRPFWLLLSDELDFTCDLSVFLDLDPDRASEAILVPASGL